MITDRTHLVHVSGHPRRDELEDLLGWVKPKMVVPVHGEALHLAEHAAVARKAGVPQRSFARTAMSCGLRQGLPAVVDEVPQGRLYKDGRLIIDGEERTVADRRRLSFVGIVSVAMALDTAGTLVGDPEVELIGVPLRRDRRSFVFGCRAQRRHRDGRQSAAAASPRSRPVADAIRRGVRAAVAAEWGKKPICVVHVVTV